MSDTTDNMIELVRSLGDAVAIHEPPCVLWKADHENCVGCEYELGCGKVVHLMLVMMMPMQYTPSGFDDYQKMQERIDDLMARAMEAKTIDELKAVPHH